MAFFVFWGFFLWAVGTLVFRFAGQYFFTPDNTLAIVLIFIGILPGIAAVTYPVYAWRKITPSSRPLAVIYMAFPGLLLDAVSVSFFPKVFPNLSLEVERYFAGGLLLAYGVAVLTGFVFNSQAKLSQEQTPSTPES